MKKLNKFCLITMLLLLFCSLSACSKQQYSLEAKLPGQLETTSPEQNTTAIDGTTIDHNSTVNPFADSAESAVAREVLEPTTVKLDLEKREIRFLALPNSQAFRDDIKFSSVICCADSPLVESSFLSTEISRDELLAALAQLRAAAPEQTAEGKIALSFSSDFYDAGEIGCSDLFLGSAGLVEALELQEAEVAALSETKGILTFAPAEGFLLQASNYQDAASLSLNKELLPPGGQSLTVILRLIP